MSEPTSVGEILDSQIGTLENKPSKGPKGNPNNVPTKGTVGGPRPGGGRPKGKLSKKTLDAMQVAQQVRQRIMQNADKLINAQMSLATGTQSLMVVITEGAGKNQRRRHEVVTDLEVIKQYLDYEHGLNDAEDPSDDTHYYYLTTQRPSNQAIDSLMNRAFGKAPEKIEISGGFFIQGNLTVEVVGSKHADIDITDDGQVFVAGEPADSKDTSIAPPGPSPESPGPSPDS